MKPLTDRRVLMFVGEDYEDLELWYPKLRLEAAGAQVVLAGLEARTIYTGKHGYPCRSEEAMAELKSGDYDGLVIPGGWMPDKLRRDAAVLRLVKEFFEAGKMVATICHGPWILISAGVCRGLRLTSTPGIRDDVENAGATWVDEPVVIDGHVISSRRPPDLPAFGEALVALLNESRGPR